MLNELIADIFFVRTGSDNSAVFAVLAAAAVLLLLILFMMSRRTHR
jgi:LPXTG-motif cell wall-anchored protein